MRTNWRGRRAETANRMKVRDVIRLIEDDGWRLVRTRGSHRHFKHATKPGLVTIAGHPGVDMPRGHVEQCAQAGWAERLTDMRYAIVIEEGDDSFGAYVPDLPGCVAAGTTRAEAVKLIHEAIEEHIQVLLEEGLPVPQPRSTAEYVEVQPA